MDNKSTNFDTQSLSSTAPLLVDNGCSSTRQTSRSAFLEYHFYKGNGIISKAKIACTDGREFCLDADIHQSKESSIELRRGKNTKGAHLGTVTFPTTYNNFNMHLTDASFGISSDGTPHLVKANARVGHPHPSAYNMKLPATATSQAREVSWTNSSRKGSKIISYKLCDDMNQPIASWSLAPDDKYQAVLRWHVESPSEVEERIVLLSFIGGLSRLRLKSKAEISDWPSTMTRYNAFWFMAILGTAGVA